VVPNAVAPAVRVAQRRRAVALVRHSRGRGAIDRSDRGPLGPFGSDREGVVLRCHRGEGSGGQGPLPGRVPRLRRLHAAAQWQGRRVRVCKACHPGALGRRWAPERVLAVMTEWRSRYGRSPTSYDLRLVAYAGRSAWGRGAQATRRRRVARVERGHPALRHLGCRSCRGSRPNVEVPTSRPSAKSRLGSNSISLPNPRKSTAKSVDLRGGGEGRQ
jgi:hypothetical protein